MHTQAHAGTHRCLHYLPPTPSPSSVELVTTLCNSLTAGRELAVLKTDGRLTQTMHLCPTSHWGYHGTGGFLHFSTHLLPNGLLLLCEKTYPKALGEGKTTPMALQVKFQETGTPPRPWLPVSPHLLFCWSVAIRADRTFSLLVPKCENSPGHWLPVLYQICLNLTASRQLLITKQFFKYSNDTPMCSHFEVLGPLGQRAGTTDAGPCMATIMRQDHYYTGEHRPLLTSSASSWG